MGGCAVYDSQNARSAAQTGATPRVYGFSVWALVVLFGLLAVIHVVLTVLFYTGMSDQGVGRIFSLEWPGWLVTLADATAAALL